MQLDINKFASLIDEKNIKFLIFSGAWCPMCISAMPKLIKLANSLDLSDKEFEFIEVNTSKSEPADLINQYDITRVPTVVVLSNEKEIGRITEYYKSSWADDLFEIASK